MIEMTVGVDDSDHRTVADVLSQQIEPCFSSFRNHERIDDDEPCISKHNSHICVVEPANLVDAVGQLEETRFCDQACVSPQARIHGGRRGLTEEGADIQIPKDLAVCIDNPITWYASNEATIDKIEVVAIGERQASCKSLQRGASCGGAWFSGA